MILVVDDDPEVRQLCQVVLEGEGYAVRLAEDAPSGIAAATSDRPDLVLLDWMMPGVDGMDALRAIKTLGATKDIPVVMLTALDSPSEIVVATLNGADGYVTKPFEVEDLLRLVQRFTDLAPAP